MTREQQEKDEKEAEEEEEKEEAEREIQQWGVVFMGSRVQSKGGKGV